MMAVLPVLLLIVLETVIVSTHPIDSDQRSHSDPDQNSSFDRTSSIASSHQQWNGSNSGSINISPSLENDTRPGPFPTGPKPFNMSSLPYLFQNPYLTVHTSDFETEGKIAIYISASFEQNMSCKWFLNGRPLDEYDVMETKDIGSYEVDNRTFLKRACHLEQEHVFRLPTLTGSYEFGCLVTMDSSSKMITHTLSPLLTDSCPPANCYTRNALCQEGTCICGGAYPVRIHSVHVTCRPAALLERPCQYDQQCLHTAEHSECVEERWCACKPGYGRTQNYLCTEKAGVNARCETDDDCLLFNARCILKHCLCNRNATEDNHRCVDIGFWRDHVHRIHGGATALGLSTRVILLALSFVACLSKL